MVLAIRKIAMVDPTEWLENYRASDKTDHISFEYNIEDEDLESIEESARLLGMDLNEFINYSLVMLIERENDKSN